MKRINDSDHNYLDEFYQKIFCSTKALISTSYLGANHETQEVAKTFEDNVLMFC